MSECKPRELCDALVALIERKTTYLKDKVEDLTANYSEKDLQEAVRLKTEYPVRGYERKQKGLLLHHACKQRAPLELIEMLLDNDTDKRTSLEKDDCGRLPIHLACYSKAPVEVIQLLLDSDTDKKSIFEKDDDE